jgi:hypothetical protein
MKYQPRSVTTVRFLKLIGQGKTQKEACEILGISEAAADNCLRETIDRVLLAGELVKPKKYKKRNVMCEECRKPFTQIDLKDGLTAFRGKRLCSRCLCPDRTDEEMLLLHENYPRERVY